MPKLTDVPIADMLKSLPKLSTNLAGDPVAFDLTIEQWEAQKAVVPGPQWHMAFDANGAITAGEGHLGGDAIPFIIKQAGGYNTLIGMFVHGLADGTMGCAQMSMMMGKIGIPLDKMKKVQSFFNRVQIGLEPIQKAMAENGIAVDGE